MGGRRYDLLCLHPRQHAACGALGPVVLVTSVTASIHLLDIARMRVSLQFMPCMQGICPVGAAAMSQGTWRAGAVRAGSDSCVLARAGGGPQV
eukprot:588886-Rhodomonas_salina.1